VRRSFRFNRVTVGARCRSCHRSLPTRTYAPSSLQKIRLSSDGDNPLNGSRNWWADCDRHAFCRLHECIARLPQASRRQAPRWGRVTSHTHRCRPTGDRLRVRDRRQCHYRLAQVAVGLTYRAEAFSTCRQVILWRIRLSSRSRAPLCLHRTYTRHSVRPSALRVTSKIRDFKGLVVGAAGFEPTTWSTQNSRATRLRYAPALPPSLDTRFGLGQQAAPSSV
jgi:hypothetical protein